MFVSLESRCWRMWIVVALVGAFCPCASALELSSEEAAAVVAQPPVKPAPFRAIGAREKLTIPDVPRDEVICFSLYTIHLGVLKLSAQLYPLSDNESRDVTLEFDRGAGWEAVATQPVDTEQWMTTFRVENWDDSHRVRYRLTHPNGAAYEGTIRDNPVDRDEIVVAAFTGNSNRDRRPRADIVRNIKAQNPDLLFFSGDQSYDHKQHLAAWLLFGRQFGEIIKDRPTVTIPDDHDVGQANLWGAAGKKSHMPGGADGGYIMPVDYVNRVQRAQTAHLPDPIDPTPIKRGITVYYTALNVGGVDFAIIEDRKWKTGPNGLVPRQGPRPDHINDPNYDPATVDLPEAQLLGERQLRFLREWGQNWEGVEMKSVLSQTIFAGGAHIHGNHEGRLLADMDSNGWPQSGRARALQELRRCYAFHIAGDQHLATVIHHGINNWEDSNWSFCVPSIVNFYGRWWWPLEERQGNSPFRADLPFTGRFYDGFHNQVTMHAYANPTEENHNAAGYGIVRFKKSTREITMECWPRHVEVSSSEAQQFPGWPITIKQTDNYARQPMGYLPKLKIDVDDAVVQVFDSDLEEPVYTLRIKGREYQAPVFRAGSYTVRISKGVETRELLDVRSTPEKSERVIDVDF